MNPSTFEYDIKSRTEGLPASPIADNEVILRATFYHPHTFVKTQVAALLDHAMVALILFAIVGVSGAGQPAAERATRPRVLPARQAAGRRAHQERLLFHRRQVLQRPPRPARPAIQRVTQPLSNCCELCDEQPGDRVGEAGRAVRAAGAEPLRARLAARHRLPRPQHPPGLALPILPPGRLQARLHVHRPPVCFSSSSC